MNALLLGSLLGAALGLALSGPSRPAPWTALGLFATVAVLSSFVPIPADWRSHVATGAALSVTLSAACTYLPRLPRYAGWALAANAGFWIGALVAGQDNGVLLALMLPWALLVIPANLLSQRRARLAVQVVASWLIAVSILAAALPLVTVPSYTSDHME